MEQFSTESILGNNSASPSDISIAPEHGFSVEMVIQSDIQSGDELPSPDHWQSWFKTWLGQLQPDYSPIQSYELSLSLTTDDGIQSLNRQYRQLDKPTNVLAFALLDGGLPPADVLAILPVELGDIIISVETAQREAQQHGHSLECELAWLASHGLLHLLGWDHPDDQQLKQMLDQQTVLLRAVNFTVSDQFYYAAETY